MVWHRYEEAEHRFSYHLEQDALRSLIAHDEQARILLTRTLPRPGGICTSNPARQEHIMITMMITTIMLP